MSRIETKVVRGAQVTDYLESLAQLRIKVFREYPYLYEGQLEPERAQLAKYAKASTSLFVLALDGSEVVGVSTAVAMSEASRDIAESLRVAKQEPDNWLYFGESVLLADYRGLGLGHAFFDAREAHAKQLGITTTCFCSIVRHPNDPRRPSGYRSLDDFWKKRGYACIPDAYLSLSWREVGDTVSTSKSLAFWARDS